MTRGNSAADTPLPLSLCAGWGLGTLGISVMFNTTGILMQRYATDYLGIAAATWGTIYLAAKLYDAVTDPLMGMASDRTRSRLGRRRPYLLWGGLLCAVAFIALFHAPGATGNSQAILVLTLLMLLYSTGYTIFNVPYMAMPAEMSRDYDDRSRLVSFRVYAIGFGTIVGVSVAPWLVRLFGGGQPGHHAMAWILGGVIALATVGSFFLTARAPATRHVQREDIGFGQRMAMLLENRPFLLLLSVKCLQLAGLALNQAVLVYFMVHVLQRGYGFLGLYGLIASLGILLANPGWLWLSRQLGKKRVYIVASFLYSLLMISWLWSGPGEPVWLILLRGFLLGCGSGGLLLMGQAMLPDAIGHDSARSGLRREGILAGFYTTAEKLAGALGGAISGWYLGLMGYVSSTRGAEVQPDSAIQAIYWSMSIWPAVLTLISCAVLLFYDLDRAKVTAHQQASP